MTTISFLKPCVCLCPSAGGLKVHRDPVQALGLATLLLCFCQVKQLLHSAWQHACSQPAA